MDEMDEGITRSEKVINPYRIVLYLGDSPDPIFMTFSVPPGREGWEYTDEFLDKILSDSFRHNREWNV